ncbi:MAG: GspH/FimT family pseudopilin [Pseudomonadota bacterium]
MKTQNTQNGFTLIELIVTMAIAAIVLSVGVPTFRGTIANNAMIADANRFVTSVNLARSSAVKFQRDATICVSTDWNNAVPTCTGGSDWSAGWIVFVDKDRDNTVDADEVLAVNEPLNDRATFASAGQSSFTYNSRGFVDTGDTLTLCDNRTGEMGRQVRINGAGRARVVNQACS